MEINDLRKLAFDSYRPKQNRRRFYFFHRLPLTLSSNVNERAPERVNGN
jgi:hypothetical protein